MQRKSLYLSKEMFDIEIFTIDDHFRLTEFPHCGVPKVDIWDILNAYKRLTDLQENKDVLRDLQQELWSKVKPSHVCIFGILVNKQTHKLGWILLCTEAVDLSIHKEQKVTNNFDEVIEPMILTPLPNILQNTNDGFCLSDFELPPYKDILTIFTHHFLQASVCKCTIDVGNKTMHDTYESILMEEHKTPIYSIHNSPYTFCRKFFITCYRVFKCAANEKSGCEFIDLQTQHIFGTQLIYLVQLPTDISNSKYTNSSKIPMFPVSNVVITTTWEIEEFVKKHLSENIPSDITKGFWVSNAEQNEDSFEYDYEWKNIYGAVFVNATVK